MRMGEKLPSDRLNEPRRPWLIAGVGALSLALIGGAAFGVNALVAANAAPEIAIVGDTPEPTPTEPANIDPVAAIAAPGVSDLAVTLDASASADEDGTIDSYAWNFGDGTNAVGATTSHTYAGAGTYTVTMTVSDNDGGWNSTTVDVTVAAPPPPPSSAIKCPAGSQANSGDGVNDTSCFPDICFNISLPNPDHPECDEPFRP